MGRKRILPMLSFHGQGLLLLAAVSSPHCKSVRRSCAPPFSAHVRLGEHGAPVQGRGLQSSLPRLRRRRTPRRLPPNLVSQSLPNAAAPDPPAVACCRRRPSQTTFRRTPFSSSVAGPAEAGLDPVGPQRLPPASPSAARAWPAVHWPAPQGEPHWS